LRIEGRACRAIEATADGGVQIIDQTLLPHELRWCRLERMEDAAEAIAAMRVRGAPLIGVTGAYGVALQAREDGSDAALAAAHERLLATRPTAVNLGWALDEVARALREVAPGERAERAFALAGALADADVAANRAIGEHGERLLVEAWERSGGSRPLRILTHCNAGWLATVDWGTALAPVYRAHDRGIPLHVWVDETRPRNQGAGITAWELLQHGVPHAVVVDNAGGHLMQKGQVDLCITGTDRTTATGDVCNKIGTYLKALAARDNGVPFYVALPSSTIDWKLRDGVAEIPIEERDEGEVRRVAGRDPEGRLVEVTIVPDGSGVANYGFDVTPARLVTALVTERGVCEASEEGLLSLFPERAGEG